MLIINPDNRWAKVGPLRTFRQIKAFFQLAPFHRAIHSAIRAVGPIITHDKILVGTKQEYGLFLAGKGVNVFTQVGFNQDFPIYKHVAIPNLQRFPRQSYDAFDRIITASVIQNHDVSAFDWA